MNSRLSTSTQALFTRDNAENLLAGMLAIFTPSGQERPLAEWLCEHLSLYDLDTEVDEVGNFIGVLPATVANPESPIVLLGHMDTVAGIIPVRCEGDRLSGRGAVDAKGPLAAFIAATVRLSLSDQPRQRDIIVVGAVEEEAATSLGARTVLNRWRPAFTIIGEPSGASAVTLGYKGRLLVTYHAEQSVAHTARPEEGVCARGVAFWLAVRDAANAWNAQHAGNSQFDALAPTLRAMQSGSDGFIDWCEMTIGYRLPPGCDIPALQNWIAETAIATGDHVEFRGAEEAFFSAPNGPLVSAFVRGLRAENLTPAFKRKTGTSDMNVVGPVWNCPIVAYGPGDASLDHTPDEHISLTEYHQGIAVLTRVLADLVGERQGA